MNSFGCEAILAESDFAPVEEEEADEPEETEEAAEEVVEEAPEAAAEEESEVVEEHQEELQTENIGTINLDDILSGLPENDVELKALIDEIME